jgi:hypothetical protein
MKTGDRPACGIFPPTRDDAPVVLRARMASDARAIGYAQRPSPLADGIHPN